MSTAVNTKAAAYGKATRLHSELAKQVESLQHQLRDADVALRKAALERNRTQRELLEEAQQY